MIRIVEFLGRAEIVKWGNSDNINNILNGMETPQLIDAAMALKSNKLSLQAFSKVENSFIHAIAPYLKLMTAEIKNVVINYMFNNLNDYKALCQTLITSGIDGINLSSELNDQFIQAALDALNLSVQIINLDGSIQQIAPKHQQIAQQIKILYTGKYYLAVLPTKNNIDTETRVEEITEENNHESTMSSGFDTGRQHSDGSSSSSSSAAIYQNASSTDLFPGGGGRAIKQHLKNSAMLHWQILKMHKNIVIKLLMAMTI